MRFLDAQLFKGEIPSEALDELQRIEGRYKTKLEPLRIIAPGRFFELEYEDKDPILLAQIEEDKFLFIYKWGSEMNVLRKLLAWPMQSVRHMIMTLGVLAGFTAIGIALMTESLMTVHPIEMAFGIFVIWGGFIMFTLFVCLAFNIFPTATNWNSRFLDR